MAYIYINGDPNTKELCGARRNPLPVNQLGSRIEVQINDSHPAYSDKERLQNYQLSSDNTQIIPKS